MITYLKSMCWIQISLIHSLNLPYEKSFEKCDCSDFKKGGFDMKIEQSKDDDLLEIRSMILSDKERKDVLVDGLVYFI